MDSERINQMKYNELQKLAKSFGIKANMKIQKLRNAVLEYYEAAEKKGETKTTDTPKSMQFSSRKSVATPMLSKTPKQPVLKSSFANTPKSTPKGDQQVKTTGTPKISSASSKNSKQKQTKKRNISETDIVATSPKDVKKRRSTFEVVPLPQSEESQPNSRRGSYTIRTEKSDSPGVTEMLASMKDGMNKEEMKESLLNALDEKVQKKAKENENSDSAKKTSAIPRFAAFLAKKREQENKKPITPGNKDWTKIHKKGFDKMESIDQYLQKKRARREDFSQSAKKTRSLLEETKAAINKLKSHNTPEVTKLQTKSALFQSPSVAKKTVTPVPFKPTCTSTKNMNLNFGNNRRSPRTSGVSVFRPSVMSTGDINFNFGKTPKTATKLTTNENTIPRKSIGAANKSFVTPFKFSATLNNTLNETQSTKKVFDLKASLAKPITWKTHKGKLKPLDVTYTNKEQSVKTPQVKASRETRRAMATKQRANQKMSKQMSRRGISVH